MDTSSSSSECSPSSSSGYSSLSSTMSFKSIVSGSDMQVSDEKASNGKSIIAENMEIYLKQICVEKGKGAAYDALIIFLQVMEKHEIMIYEIDGQEVTQEEYAWKILNELMKPEVEAELENGDKDEDAMEDENAVVWDELILQLTWTKEEEISQFELLIKKNYQDYKSLLEAEAKNLQDRHTLSYQLANNITSWAHLKVIQPDPLDQQSVNRYISEKQLQLKQIIPEITTHRSLTQKIKFIDNWGKYNITIGTDQNAGWGSVAQQLQNF
ncbi:hypothetical protein G6F56_012979 [Rhizopus delemar]|nr:hypothetical protein G6F56_012979 [Rhizopus delemar]